MLKFFRLPFATTGDKTAVPDAVDSNGNVSYSQGYGFDYQRQKTDPAAKNIERDKMNQIFFDMTTAIAEIQSQGIPDFITSALNGGTAYSYAQYAIVKYSGALYISLVAANTALPSDATKWALLPTPALMQQAAYMSAVAGGTVDAITAAFTPAIAALPAAPGTLSVFVRAGGANATTTPTFKADGTLAKAIVKGNNLPLAVGDIAGAGHWLELQYDATLDKWVLQNPALGVSGAASVVGTTQNVIMSVTAASATATLTADEIIVETALGGAAHKLASFNKTINLATTGAGGMDTGAAPVSGYVALYAIYNPSTGASALLATNATAAAQPNIYGGANIPAGYTASALVSVWATNASGQFKVGYQIDRTVFFPNVALFTAGTATTPTSFSLAAACPKNAKAWNGNMGLIPTASAGLASVLNLSADAAGTGMKYLQAPWNTGGVMTGINFDQMPIITSQTAYYSTVNPNGNNVQATSYTF